MRELRAHRAEEKQLHFWERTLRKKAQDDECKFLLLLQINNNLRHPDEMSWNHVSMCILNGGGIRSPIDERNNGMLLGPGLSSV